MTDLRKIDLVKEDLLRGLFKKNVNLTDAELAKLTNFSEKRVHNIRSSQLGSDSQDVLSWDYVLVFDVGEEDKNIEPTRKDRKRLEAENGDETEEWRTGMPRKKFFGQIVHNIRGRLEHSKLSVQAYRSSDGSLLFLLVGISEYNLKEWADTRDTDLLCDKRGGVMYGRERRFPLAMRTVVNDNNDFEVKDDIDNTQTINIDNWDSLYMEYNRFVPQTIYTNYERIPGDDSIMTPFNEKTRLRIIYETMISDSKEGGVELAFEELIKNKRHPLRAAFPLHNPRKLDYFEQYWIRNFHPWLITSCPLEEIRTYFGEPVGFYFAFLQFYLRWLKWPSIIGLIFFIEQIIYGSIDAPGIYLMSFFTILWCVGFVDFWYREEARLRLRWGMTKFSEKAVARPQFQGEWKHDEVTGLWTETFSIVNRLFRQGAIMSGILLFLAACVAAVLSILLVRDASPNDTTMKVYLGVANGGMIFVFDTLYSFCSTHGNEWENHRTDQDYQNALIQKSFFFKFFNSFASLFYLGFMRPWFKGNEYYIKVYNTVCKGSEDYMYDFVRTYDRQVDDGDWLRCMNADCQISDDACKLPCFGVVWTGYQSNSTFYDASTGDNCGGGEIDDDYYCSLYCEEDDTIYEINDVVLKELRLQLASLFITAIVIQNTLEVLVPFIIHYFRDYFAKKKIERSGEVVQEKSEAQMQAGLNPYESTIEDMSELVIQFGYVTLFVIALPVTPLLAWINNVIEMKVDAVGLCKSSQRPHPNGSYGLGAWNGTIQFFSYISVLTNVGLITWRTQLVNELIENIETSWMFFCGLAIILALLVAAEKALIPDVPLHVKEAMERQELVESVLVLGANVDFFEEDAPQGDSDVFSFDPDAEFTDVDVLTEIPLNGIQYGADSKAGQSGQSGAIQLQTFS